MKSVTTAGAMVLSVFLVSACDDRQERIEETAAPGMEQDAAAPGSGPVDGFQQVEPAHEDTMTVDRAVPPGSPTGHPAPPDE